MEIGLDTHTRQALLVSHGTGLATVVCDDDRTDVETTVHKLATQAEHIFVVSNTEVTPHFVLFNVDCTDNNNNLGRIGQLLKHTQLAVGPKTRQDTAGVVVVEKFAT